MRLYAAETHLHSLACAHVKKKKKKEHSHTHTEREIVNLQTHKPVGFEITAVVREYAKMPSAYKGMHIQIPHCRPCSPLSNDQFCVSSWAHAASENRGIDSNQESRMAVDIFCIFKWYKMKRLSHSRGLNNVLFSCQFSSCWNVCCEVYLMAIIVTNECLSWLLCLNMPL